MAAWRLWLAFGLAAGLLWVPGRPASGAMTDKDMVIAVADFNGKDPELSEGIAETLLTDLAKSSRLHLVERKQLRRAFTEVKLSAAGLTDSKKVKKLGTTVGADKLIVGSYALASESIIINARLLDVATGKLTPGGAENIQGSRAEIFALVHKLANRFHKRLTGEWIPDLDSDADASDVLRGSPDPEAGEDATGMLSDIASSPSQPEIRKVVTARIMSPYADGTFRPKAAVTEKEFDAILRRLSHHIRPEHPKPFTVQEPSRPVTRLRALVALARMEIPQNQFDMMVQPMTSLASFPDGKDVPRWGRVYIAVAVDQNYLPRAPRLYPNAPATRGMIAALIGRMLAPNPEEEQISLPSEDPNGYTGVIIDARGLGACRSMSPRIVAADGRIVYPQQDHLPTMGYLQDHGIVSYVHSPDRAAKAGSRPIYVRGQDASGPCSDTVIISSGDADRILQENERSHFLWRWQVCFVIDGGR
ncbi:MAG: S-layer homology domain-containing protein [Armatimonadetes bacterium]|nr:S-layer homology domain-containing protein [Armatimonadota bacterium]